MAASFERARRTILRLLRQRAANGNLARDQRGDSLVEFAMTLPVLLLFLLGLTEMCLAYYTYEWISEAAREGTRYAIVRGTTCETSAGVSCLASPSEVNTYVTSIGLPNLGGGTMVANTTYPGTGSGCSGGSGSEAPGCPVQIVVTYVYPYKIPWVTSTNLSLTSTSEMYIVQ
jgi:Flp pilus assembly protein TadG